MKIRELFYTFSYHISSLPINAYTIFLYFLFILFENKIILYSFRINKNVYICIVV